MDFHTRDIDETLSILETDTSGLKSEEASKRQEQYGLNILPSKPDMTLFAHFLQQFKSPIIYIPCYLQLSKLRWNALSNSIIYKTS